MEICNPGPTSDVYSATIQIAPKVFEELDFEIHDGLPICEGDIILALEPSRLPEAVSVHPDGIAIKGSKFFWPKGLIPVQIHESINFKDRIKKAIDHWESKTNLEFAWRNDSNKNKYPNYVEFVLSTGCASHVGMRTGRQQIRLSEHCRIGNVIHEVGHTAGFWHEHSRADRDNHITIKWDNIKDGKKHNFKQHVSDGTDIGEYDYGSIMHYSRRAFAKDNSLPSIVPKKDVEIGQREGLSAGDISTIETKYS